MVAASSRAACCRMTLSACAVTRVNSFGCEIYFATLAIRPAVLKGVCSAMHTEYRVPVLITTNIFLDACYTHEQLARPPHWLSKSCVCCPWAFDHTPSTVGGRHMQAGGHMACGWPCSCCKGAKGFRCLVAAVAAGGDLLRVPNANTCQRHRRVGGVSNQCQARSPQ